MHPEFSHRKNATIQKSCTYYQKSWLRLETLVYLLTTLAKPYYDRARNLSDIQKCLKDNHSPEQVGEVIKIGFSWNTTTRFQVLGNINSLLSNYFLWSSFFRNWSSRYFVPNKYLIKGNKSLSLFLWDFLTWRSRYWRFWLESLRAQTFIAF